MNEQKKRQFDFEDLLDIMAKLRSKDGCPWDKQQTHDTLRQYILEEAYEVVDAIDHHNDDELIEELGDVLFQVVFHAQIASEEGRFTIQDVIDGICKKMINRHTHVFAAEKVDTVEQVLNNWEKIKNQEKRFEDYTGKMKAIPAVLPALMRSYKVQKKAALAGFDWETIDGPLSKVYEELNELKEAYNKGDKDEIFEELGDLLFAVVNVSRFLDAQPELALLRATDKFIKRFEYMENAAKKAGKNLEDMSFEEMDKLWERSKL